VRQGRTDAWIAHKIDVSIDELARFKREHQLDGGAEESRARPADPLSVPPPEPRSMEPDEPEDEEEEEEEEAREEPQRDRPRSRSRSRSRSRRRPAAADVDGDEGELEDEVEYEEDASRADEPQEEDGAQRRRRRRGRRGGRRHRARRHDYEATFDHGGEGYGLWLDPSVVDNPVYAEHWAGHRAVTVTFDADAITIRRADARAAGDADEEAGSDD
jgi:hypothetical protein